MTATLPTLEVQYRRAGDSLPTLEDQFAELFQLTRALGSFSPLLQRWFLASNTSKEDALMYEAFDADGPTTAALAVLREENKGVDDLRTISLWNGAEASAEGAGLTSRCVAVGRPSAVSLRLKARPEVADWKTGAAWIENAVRIWPALFASFAPFWYSEKSVFQDRPGVGWMLYLPQVLTAQNVPEAGALIPVLGEKKKQTGTIIVSVTDEPFSADNPEHVKIANKIEVRLVDQDLLPRFADL